MHFAHRYEVLLYQTIDYLKAITNKLLSDIKQCQKYTKTTQIVHHKYKKDICILHSFDIL